MQKDSSVSLQISIIVHKVSMHSCFNVHHNPPLPPDQTDDCCKNIKILKCFPILGIIFKN